MKKPTPILAALFMFGLLSMFEVVISKAIEQICLCSEEHAAKIMHFLETAKQNANKLIKNGKQGREWLNFRSIHHLFVS